LERGGQPARRGTVQLRECIGELLRLSGLDRGLEQARVLGAWRESLGQELAPRARAVRFKAGELVVEVLSAAHRQELVAFSGDGYRRAANQRLGAEVIRRVTFRLKQ
jgi:hypothetical protein